MSRHDPTLSLRHMLEHAYDSIDFDILWNIISKDIPALIDALEKSIPISD